MPPFHRPKRRWLLLLSALLLAWLAAGLGAALLATRATRSPVPQRSDLAGRAVVDAELRTGDGLHLCGWLVRPGPTSDRCVVLAAGLHGNRLAMIDRAEWYLQHGCATLLVDLRGTGSSDGARISMGLHEADDLLAWRRWLRQQGFTRIGAHGISLGAAAIAYSARDDDSDAGWDFAVLESCYDDIRTALQRRLPWMPLPRLLLWPMVVASQWLLHADVDAMQPVDAIRFLRAPTVIACGDADSKVGAAATAALFAACGSAQKQLVWIPGLGHSDLWPAGEPLRTALRRLLATQ